MKGIELVPDLTFLETISLVGQVVFADILQKGREDVIQREEVQKLWAILAVSRGDPFQHLIGDILQFASVGPKLVKQRQVGGAFRGIDLVDHAEHVAAALTAQVGTSKSVDGRKGTGNSVFHRHKSGHQLRSHVGFK